MEIQCDCGKFKARINYFKGNNAGRLVCYCDDCQSYLKRLQREDLLDPYGGTEIIPVYPNHFEILKGADYLQCNILKENGLHRWSVNCCNTPLANTKPNFPWVGIPYRLYLNNLKNSVYDFGEVKIRIMGKYKTSAAPFLISDKLKFSDLFVISPFVIKGFLLLKYGNSPFYMLDKITPIVEQKLL